jgi:Fe-S cluster assembly protein SufD
MLKTKDARDSYLAAFEAMESSQAVPAWLLPIRKAAIARFAEMGFPTSRDEDWKYTDTRFIADTAFRPAAPDAVPDADDLRPYRLEDADVHRLVVVNGRVAEALSSIGSLPRGVRVGSLSAAMRDAGDAVQADFARLADYRNQPFAALNTALFADGTAVIVPPGAAIEKPLHLIHVTSGSADSVVAHPRTLIKAGANSQVTVIETFVSLGDTPCFTNAIAEIRADQGARVDHYKVERDKEDSCHVGGVAARLDRDSTVRTHLLTLGGRLVRNEVLAVLDGEGSHCTINGLYLLNGRQHVDNHLRVEHAKPHCTSWEYFKGVLNDRSRGVFTGRIYVAEDAQKTDAKQTNMSLLLSEEAQVESRPQLEIFADDVRCTHGATIGQVDDQALFYLRARGLDSDTARSLLIYGFAEESLQQIQYEPLRQQLEHLLFARLPQAALLREEP